MGMLPALDIGRSGLLAQELGITVSGNNIANVNTPGYTRQRADLAEEMPAVADSGVLTGRGVRARGVQQVIDPLLERRLKNVLTDQAQQGARHGQLQLLADALSNVTEPSLATQIDSFFDAADELARNPAGLAERETLLGAARTVTTELNRRSTEVATLQRGQDEAVLQRVTQVNDQLARIADLNVQIASAELGGQNAGGLRDERTVALQTVARSIGVDVLEKPDGSTRVSAKNGVVLVDAGTVTHKLAVQGGASGLDGQLLHDVGLTTSGGAGFVQVDGAFASGEIGALVGVRDGEMVQASTNLDTFANTFAGAVNGVQQNASAVDLDGLSTVGVPFFGGSGAGGITVAITDARRVAAARSTQPGDAQNALALADLRTTPQAGMGSLTPAGWLGAEDARLGEQASQAGDIAHSSDLLVQQVQSERDSVSGVNLNEELTNLLKYQHAYEACTKVISVADEMLTELMSLVR